MPHLVEITIGGGRPVPASSDSGSVRLYVMESDVELDVERTTTPIHQGYVAGTRYEGFVGLAPVGFPEGGITGRIITRVSGAGEQRNVEPM